MYTDVTFCHIKLDAYQGQFPEVILLPAVSKSIQEYTIEQVVQLLIHQYEAVANPDVDEKVNVFSVRLLEALNKLTFRFADRILIGYEHCILCERFFHGMEPESKGSVQHVFNLHDITFDILLTVPQKK